MLRMLQAAVKQVEVDERRDLNDADVLKILTSYARKVKDQLAGAESSGRAELVAQAQAELEVVQEFLPAEMDDAALEAAVREAIAESGAAGPEGHGQGHEGRHAQDRGPRRRRPGQRHGQETAGGLTWNLRCWIAVAVIAFFALWGFKDGVVKRLIEVAGAILTVMLTARFAAAVTPTIADKTGWSQEASLLVSWVLLIFVGLVASRLLARVISKAVQPDGAGLGGPHRRRRVRRGPGHHRLQRDPDRDRRAAGRPRAPGGLPRRSGGRVHHRHGAQPGRPGPPGGRRPLRTSLGQGGAHRRRAGATPPRTRPRRSWTTPRRKRSTRWTTRCRRPGTARPEATP